MDDSAWETVAGLTAWLDGHNTLAPESMRLMRRMKLSEEVGEVTEAVIGVLGHNPRKGRTHSWDDVPAELCDVIVTAMVALTSLTPDAPEVFAAHLARVAARSREQPPGRPPSAAAERD